MAAIRPAGDFDISYAHDMAVIRRPWQWAAAVGLVAFLFAVPAFSPPQFLDALNLIGIFLVSVQGLAILVGYTGQISLGQAAFMTVGAYASAVLTKYAGVPFWFALPLAGLGAGLVGLIFGLPSLRIKGFYLAMATLAAQFIIPWIFRGFWVATLGGATGIQEIPVPRLAGFAFDSEWGMYFIILVVAILTTIAMKNLARTRTGRAFVAIRDNDLAAEVLGINIVAYKLRAFFLSAFYAGLAGSLWAHYLRSINPEQLDLIDSVWMLGMVIVGGMGSALGPILGTVFIRLLRELVSTLTPNLNDMLPGLGANLAGLGPLVFGFALALFLVFEPHGLALAAVFPLAV
ncbi:MAG: branched-chain amino acid ABC transporter permease [Anaerolineales bacterium]|nr:MAG: branched-chain amino acid ABC transporter permease [Anaerolineales bacterium]